MDNILKRIQENFPNNKITVETIAALDDFKPYKVLRVDGKRVKSRWNVELAQDLAAYKLPNIEDEVVSAFVAEISASLHE